MCTCMYYAVLICLTQNVVQTDCLAQHTSWCCDQRLSHKTLQIALKEDSSEVVKVLVENASVFFSRKSEKQSIREIERCASIVRAATISRRQAFSYDELRREESLPTVPELPLQFVAGPEAATVEIAKLQTPLRRIRLFYHSAIGI